MNKVYIIVPTILIIALVVGAYAWYELGKLEERTPSVVQSSADSDNLDQPRLLSPHEVVRLRETLPGRSPGMESAVVSTTSLAHSTGGAVDEDGVPLMDDAPASATLPESTPTEDTRLEESVELSADVGDDPAVPPTEPTAADEDEVVEPETGGGLGIEVLHVSVTDQDANGATVALTIEGTVMGTDVSNDVFTLAESDSDESYRVAVTADTEFFIEGTAMDFADLMVGDIVVLSARGTTVARDVTAVSVDVVAKLQLFDDGQ